MQLLEQIGRQYKAGLGDYSGLIVESSAKGDSWAPMNVCLVRRLDNKVISKQYYAGNNPDIPGLPADLKQHWANLTTSEFISYESELPTYREIACIDGRVFKVQQNGKKTHSTHDRHPERSVPENLMWRVVDFLANQSPTCRFERDLLDPDSDEDPDWIGLKVKTTDNRKDVDRPTRSCDTYWFDKSKNYVLMRHVREGDITGTFPRGFRIERCVAEVQQTHTGTWYASRFVNTYETERPKRSADGFETVKSVRQQRILIDQDIIPPQSMFDEDALSYFTAPPKQVGPGDPAPPISIKHMLNAPAGLQLSWDNLQNKTIVIEFWSTMCTGCVKSIPHMNHLYQALHPEGIEFLSVTFDEPDVVERFVKKTPIHSWIGCDTDQSMFVAYGITGYPTAFVIRNGLIVERNHPLQLSPQHIRALACNTDSDEK